MSNLVEYAGKTGESFPSDRPRFEIKEESPGYESQSQQESQFDKSGILGRSGFGGEFRNTRHDKWKYDDSAILILANTGSQNREPRLGGPVQFVLKLLDFWNLSRDDAIRLLGFGTEDAEYAGRILWGEEKLHGRDIKERIGHLFHIRGTLRALFRDLQTENDWLREEHSLLDEKSPLEILLEGSMESLLLVREYVDTVAGM